MYFRLLVGHQQNVTEPGLWPRTGASTVRQYRKVARTLPRSSEEAELCGGSRSGASDQGAVVACVLFAPNGSHSALFVDVLWNIV